LSDFLARPALIPIERELYGVEGVTSTSVNLVSEKITAKYQTMY